ncbi:MAG: hypothetical protein RPS47_18185 [Colwellia sp.]
MSLPEARRWTDGLFKKHIGTLLREKRTHDGITVESRAEKVGHYLDLDAVNKNKDDAFTYYMELLQHKNN